MGTAVPVNGRPKREMHVVDDSTKRDATLSHTFMSETPADSPAPRRSQRDKKIVKPFTAGTFTPKKFTV